MLLTLSRGRPTRCRPHLHVAPSHTSDLLHPSCIAHCFLLFHPRFPSQTSSRTHSHSHTMQTNAYIKMSASMASRLGRPGFMSQSPNTSASVAGHLHGRPGYQSQSLLPPPPSAVHQRGSRCGSRCRKVQHWLSAKWCPHSCSPCKYPWSCMLACFHVLGSDHQLRHCLLACSWVRSPSRGLCFQSFSLSSVFNSSFPSRRRFPSRQSSAFSRGCLSPARLDVIIPSPALLSTILLSIQSTFVAIAPALIAEEAMGYFGLSET